MDGSGPGYRLLLVGRALFLGILWGVVFGEAIWSLIIAVGLLKEGADGLLPAIVLSPVAGLVGGVVGGAISLTSGLALALSGREALRRTWHARLVSGSAAAAVPLAVGWELRPVDFRILIGMIAAAAVTAVLRTPRILTGPPPPRRWQPGMPAGPAPVTRSEQ
ncbi:MAG: hypothetical protein QOE23_3059 [Pseudonocardiales bacterium]|jgi:hypothetical protein|nr:hypothetical protein [Pseudonocardiales bacterium]